MTWKTASVCILLVAVAISGDLTCSQASRATKGGIQYPSSMGLDCPAATAAAESSLTSYHYRKACQEKFNLPTVPSKVAEAKAINCFVAPAPGWSDGTIVEVEVCCDLKWGPWLDRDNPSGDGDWEDLKNFRLIGQACDNPLAIECREISTQVDASATGQTIVCDPAKGFWCRNVGQSCKDYEVRFVC